MKISVLLARDSEGPTTSNGVRIPLDGKDISGHVRSFKIRSVAGEIVYAELGLYPSGIEVEGDAAMVIWPQLWWPRVRRWFMRRRYYLRRAVWKLRHRLRTS